MNCRCGAILVLALLFAAAGCGVKAALPELTFEPEDEESDLASQPDLEAPDTVAPDSMTPDTPGEDTAMPDLPATGKSCPETMFCAISSGCFELGPSCWNGCADGNGWTKGPTAKLKICLEKCTTGISADSLDKCLQGSCQDAMLECFSETPGDRTCGDVLLCGMESACDKEDMTPAQSYDCFAKCFGGLKEGEIVEVNKVLDLCFVGTGGEMLATMDCMAAQFDCYGGSGEKSCDVASNCLEDCYKSTECPPDPQDCPARDKCSVECVYGMSEDASKMLFEASLCSFDSKANPFKCLHDDVACHLGNNKGQASCKAVMGSLREIYLLPCFPTDVVPVAGMTLVLDKVKPEHADSLMLVLGCLADKYGKYPGCGSIPDPEWNKCVEKCQ